MPGDAKENSKSKKKNDPKNKENRFNSFLNSLKGFLSLNSLEEQVEKEDPKTSSQTTAKQNKGSDSPIKQEKSKKKGEKKPQDQEEDPTLYFINNLKEHEKLQSLRKKKSTIIKVAATAISAILIIIGIIYSITPNEQVASNVIFGERAMFSVFLILVAFLILAAVFASKLRKGKFLRDITQDLEIVEGKKQKDDPKNSHHDPIIDGMNKKHK